MIVNTLSLFDPLGFKILALLLCPSSEHIMMLPPSHLQTSLKLDFSLNKRSNFALPSLSHCCCGGRSLTEAVNEPSFVLLASILGSLYLAQPSQRQRIHSSPNAPFSITHTASFHKSVSTSLECFTPPHHPSSPPASPF